MGVLMEICSNDEELNKTFRNWLGPKTKVRMIFVSVFTMV